MSLDADTETRISIEVYGTPASKGSSRPMLNRKTGKAFSFAGGSKVAEAKLASWDSAVRSMAHAAVGDRESPPFVDIPIAVEITFRLARPGGHWGKGRNAGKLASSAPTFPRGKPDIDKLVRSTLDSLTGIVFDDDSRVISLVTRKVYAAPGREGASIAVWKAA